MKRQSFQIKFCPEPPIASGRAWVRTMEVSDDETTSAAKVTEAKSEQTEAGAEYRNCESIVLYVQRSLNITT